MKNKAVSKTLFVLSVVSVILAFLDAVNVNVWLAATGWMIAAAVLGIWALYTDDK